MSYKLTTAIGFRDLVRLIRNFVCGYGDDNPWVYTGSAATAQLLWFGAKPQATPPAAGVTAETWTFSCTLGCGVGVATFSVTGAVSGAQAPLTVGTYYDETLISAYILIDSPNVFTIGDTFTIDVTGDSESYTNDEYWQLMYEQISPTGSRSNNYFQMQGRDTIDNNTVNIMLKTTADITQQIYAIRYMYATGYLDEPTYYPDNQPGSSLESRPTYQLSAGKANNTVANIAMPVHLFMNTRRFVVGNEVTAGKWMGAIAGLYYAHGSPKQYPFPCYVAGNANEPLPFVSSSGRINSFVDPGHLGGLIKLPGGVNDFIYHENADNVDSYVSNATWPFGTVYSNFFYRGLLPAEDETYPMFPVSLRQISPTVNVGTLQMLGELDGVCAFPGFNVAPGSTVTDGASNEWVVFRHPIENDASSYFAVRKD